MGSTHMYFFGGIEQEITEIYVLFSSLRRFVRALSRACFTRKTIFPIPLRGNQPLNKNANANNLQDYLKHHLKPPLHEHQETSVIDHSLL